MDGYNKSKVLESEEVARYIGHSSNTSSFANNNSNNNTAATRSATDIECASSSCQRFMGFSEEDRVGFLSSGGAEFFSEENTARAYNTGRFCKNVTKMFENFNY